jgi:hypothetical protein
MLESYFGLIEAAFVFGLAVAFYLWQRRDLKRAEDKAREDALEGEGKDGAKKARKGS